MRTRADTACRERVRETIRPCVFLRERESPVGADQRRMIGDGVDHPLPQVRKVELHEAGS